MQKDVPDLSEVPLHQFLPRRHANFKSYLSNNKKKTGKAKKKKKKNKGKKTNLGPKAKSTSPGTILPQIKGAARKRSFDGSECGSITSGGSRRSSVPLVPFYKRSETDRRLHLLGHTRDHHRVGLWDHHHEDQKKLREIAQRKRSLAHHVTDEEEEQLSLRLMNTGMNNMKASDDFSQLSKPKPRPWLTSAYCEDGYYDMKNHFAHDNEGDEKQKAFATPDSEVLAAYAFVMKSFEHTRKKKEKAKTSLESLEKELGLYKTPKPPSISAPKSRTPKASKAFVHSPKTMAAARASAERRQQMLLASVKESMNESQEDDDFDDGFEDGNGGDGPEVSASIEQTENKDTVEKSGNDDNDNDGTDDDDGDDDFDDDDDFEDDADVVDDGDGDDGNNDGGSDGDDHGDVGNGGDEIEDDVDDGDGPSDGGSGNASASGDDGGEDGIDGEKDGSGGGDDADEDFDDDDFDDDDFDDDDFEDD